MGQQGKALCFGLVAGEESGDILGADLILALKKTYPHATFVGIGGKRMIEAGFQSLFPLERLSVMGFIEPLKRLRELLAIRAYLKKYFTLHRPAAFIGIDAPDFNLSLEHSLKKQGLCTVHYVSPTVWAWRKRRIYKIKKAVNCVLCLFPFETAIYQEYQVGHAFVGHPLADAIPLYSSKNTAREELGLPQDKQIVAILPGSRQQELKYLAKDFLDTARWIRQQLPAVEFITPCANESTEKQFNEYLKEYPDLKLNLFQGNARKVMTASDVVLTVSGTASLEAMLVKRPTIVAYKMSPLSFAIAKRIIKIPYIALPNLLAGKGLMKEFVQNDVNPQAMGKAIIEYLQSPALSEEVAQQFLTLHQSLQKNAGASAAQAISLLIKDSL